MVSSKKYNLTKKNLSKEIFLKVGTSKLYVEIIVDDLINILKVLIKENKLVIKNFGSFKLIIKNERIGRNPKTKELYKINKRKTLSFTSSKHLIKQINFC